VTDRYLKQRLLPEIGSVGVARLAAARVLQVGAGGLGCAALPYLVGAGVGRITLVDPDRIATDNLPRQVIYRDVDVGRPKAVVAARRLRGLDPAVVIDAHVERVDAGNVEAFLTDVDVVIDGSDDFGTKFLLADACAAAGIPLVYGTVTAFEALATVLDPPASPCLRCLFPSAPTATLSCAVMGVLGPVVGIVGALQATEAIKVLLAHPDLLPLRGRLWLLDARDFTTRVVAIPRRDGCLGCALAAAAAARSFAAPAIPVVPATPVPAVATATDDVPIALLYVDVREAHELRTGVIPGALHRPLARFYEGDVTLPAAERIVLYCAHGLRSLQALRLLERAGVRHATHLPGGIAAYDGPLARVS
jgi:sulfur-carrier protein adenylyltransferase/sulfurtransferase